MYGSPMYDHIEVYLASHDDHRVLSFDVAVLMSQELDRVKEVPEEEYVEGVHHYSINENESDRIHVSDIMEEPGTSEAVQKGYVAMGESWLNNSTYLSRKRSLENGSASEICTDIK